MPAKCVRQSCGKNAILKRPKTGDALCKECFYFCFEVQSGVDELVSGWRKKNLGPLTHYSSLFHDEFLHSGRTDISPLYAYRIRTAANAQQNKPTWHSPDFRRGVKKKPRMDGQVDRQNLHSDLCSVFFPQSNHIRRKSTIRSWPAICFNAGIESPSALPAERTRPSWRMSWRLSTRVTITASNSSCSPSTKEFKATETTPWRLSRGINSSTTCRSKSCLTKVKGRGCWLQAC